MANNKKGLFARFAATPDDNQPPTPSQQDTPREGVTFTTDQWETICDTLGIEPDTTAEEFIANLTAVMESIEKTVNQADEKVAAAAAANRPVLIDNDVWEDMSRAVKLGMKALNQEQRLDAERVVDQAIRMGKIGTARREDWILEYQHDPDTVRARLGNMDNDKVPYFEVGHGRSMPDDDTTAGWVRA